LPKRRRLSDFDAHEPERFDCGKDWNAALGGGVVRGGIVLVASRGGSGKTTEMLRVAARLGTPDTPSIYCFSERSEEELASHAAFVKIDRTRIAPVPVKTIDDAIEATPTGAHLFIDSIGNLEHFDPKEIEKIREISTATAWLICHVNKRGEIEGRQKLDHGASATVWVRRTTLRTSKNWHGPQCVVPRDLPSAFAEIPKPQRKLRAVK